MTPRVVIKVEGSRKTGARGKFNTSRYINPAVGRDKLGLDQIHGSWPACLTGSGQFNLAVSSRHCLRLTRFAAELDWEKLLGGGRTTAQQRRKKEREGTEIKPYLPIVCKFKVRS